MQQFGVALYKREDVAGVHIDAQHNRREVLAFYQPQKEVMNEAFNMHSAVLWCSTQGEADTIAKELMRRFPQNTYITFKSQSFYQCPPSDVVKSNFTEKGLLPE